MKLLTALLFVTVLGSQEVVPEDRLYGRITTVGGDVFEGYLRWGPNEASWADYLNGNKEIPWENLQEAEELDEEYGRRRQQERSIRFLGIRISWDEDDDESTVAISGVRFGHLLGIDVINDRRAVLRLKSGEEVEFEGGSSDIGRSLRSLMVDDPAQGETELRWRDLDRVEFMEAPAAAGSPSAERLYGTVRSWNGLEFTGFIAWDNDEVLTSDVLDGEDDERDREIAFDRIRSIEQDGRRAAIVVLSDGEEVRLRGSNDVNDDNRGIAISDPDLGQVLVSWEDFEAVTFRSPPAGAGGSYEAFDGGRRLHGTVTTADGSQVEGEIRWDNDESFTWETLDGESDGLDMDIEFGRVDRIDRVGRWGAEVTLVDGRVFELDESNDVDEGNKGIFVTRADGETVLVYWEDFDTVTFSR